MTVSLLKKFKKFISDIYPKELTISETTESTSIASYLDLLFIRDKSNNITTKFFYPLLGIVELLVLFYDLECRMSELKPSVSCWSIL